MHMTDVCKCMVLLCSLRSQDVSSMGDTREHTPTTLYLTIYAHYVQASPPLPSGAHPGGQFATMSGH